MGRQGDVAGEPSSHWFLGGDARGIFERCPMARPRRGFVFELDAHVLRQGLVAHARSQPPNAPLTPEDHRLDRRRLRARGPVGRSRRPRSGSRSTRKRCGSGVTGSSLKVTPARSIGRRGRVGHRTGLGDRSRRRVLQLAPEASLGCRAHRSRARGVARRRCSAILARRGLRLGSIAVTGPSTAAPVQRYQRERPGELIHVDVKKLAGIPARGGWRVHGRGSDAR